MPPPPPATMEAERVRRERSPTKTSERQRGAFSMPGADTTNNESLLNIPLVRQMLG